MQIRKYDPIKYDDFSDRSVFYFFGAVGVKGKPESGPGIALICRQVTSNVRLHNTPIPFIQSRVSDLLLRN